MAAEVTQTRRCKQCREDLELTEFSWRKDRKTWFSRCKKCHALYMRDHRYMLSHEVEVRGDWAACFHKTALPGLVRGFGDAADPISSWDLRVVMAFQSNTCPFTGVELLLPTHEQVEEYVSWQRWQNTLPFDLRCSTPHLVRGDPRGHFGRGNLLWVSGGVEPLYECSGSAAALTNQIRSMAERPMPIIMPADKHAEIYARLTAAGPAVETPGDPK